MLNHIDREITHTMSELEPKAESGDADAQHHLFILLLSQAMEKYDAGLFNKAEKYLIKSAQAGWPNAIEAMNDQSLRRRAFESRVNRHKENQS